MEADKPEPPRLLLRFFQWFCHPDLASTIEGDLMELYHERVTLRGIGSAKRKLAIDIVLLLRPAIIRPYAALPHYNQIAMFKNYLKTGIRNILKYKVFSFINIFGLALAMSVCMLLILMLADQHRYDAFHAKRDRTYRIISTYRTDSRGGYATSAYPVGKALTEEYPFIEETTSLLPGLGGEGIWNQHLTEMRVYFAEPSFFKVFSFKLKSGDAASALTAPRSMVISSSIAAKLFDRENPIGKSIEFLDRQLPFPQDYGTVNSAPVSWGSFTVTGVIDEDLYKSHLHYDILVSASSMPQLMTEKKLPDHLNDWESFWQNYTFAVLQPGKSEEDLARALNSIAARHYANVKSEEMKGFKLTPQKLSDVQYDLKGNDTNNRLPLIGYYFLIILALVIMISACLNYTNLSIARALTRAREIGVRKVTGAFRKDLVIQFLSESVITTVLAMALGALMLLAIKPAFRGLWVNQYLNFELPDSFGVYAIFAGFAIFIGILAGLYPALKLSGYQPIRALKSLENKRQGGMGIRKALSVSQFVISLFFITTSILIFRQFKYFLEFDYGFKSANIVNINMQGATYAKLTQAFGTVPGIDAIGATDIVPATGRNNGTEMKVAGSTEDYTGIGRLITDENYITVMGIPLIAGTPLPVAGDSTDHTMLVNRAMALKFGFQNPSEIVGQVFEDKWGKESFRVVGVTEDFRYNLLINRHEIDPLIMRNVPREFSTITVRITSPDSRAVLKNLEEKWKTIDPVHSFSYRFFDEQLAATHQGIFDLVSILGFIAMLAVTIACLGLLGMATYTSERRKKEVGIRKVMGAGDLSMVILLSKEFLRIVAISVVIAAPLSYFVNNLWLQRLPTRVEFGYQTVILGTLIMILLGMITIGSQTLRSARTNPVEVLKMD